MKDSTILAVLLGGNAVNRAPEFKDCATKRQYDRGMSIVLNPRAGKEVGYGE